MLARIKIIKRRVNKIKKCLAWPACFKSRNNSKWLVLHQWNYGLITTKQRVINWPQLARATTPLPCSKKLLRNCPNIQRLDRLTHKLYVICITISNADISFLLQSTIKKTFNPNLLILCFNRVRTWLYAEILWCYISTTTCWQRFRV